MTVFLFQSSKQVGHSSLHLLILTLKSSSPKKEQSLQESNKRTTEFIITNELLFTVSVSWAFWKDFNINDEPDS